MAERLVTRKIPEDFFTNCKEQITAMLKETPFCESNENINDDKEQSSDNKDAENSDPDLKLKKVLENVESVEKKSMPAHQGKENINDDKEQSSDNKDAENSDPDLKLKKVLEYVESVEKKSMPAHQGKAYWYSKRNDDIMESVKIRFKEKLDTMFNKLELYELKQPKEPDMPCLVFCINSTILNEDVSDAVSGLKVLLRKKYLRMYLNRNSVFLQITDQLSDLNQYALVVLHFGSDALLPKSTSFHNIGGMVFTRKFHLAYQSEGFIVCKRNRKSFNEIVDFIKGDHDPKHFKNRLCSI